MNTRLTIISLLPKVPYIDRRCICLCICGKKKEYRLSHVKAGKIRSCGCLRKDFPNSTIHGKEGTRIYNIWMSMKQRCNNPNNPDYNNYGGRGITINPTWYNFESFYADMRDPPSPQHSLNRIDNNGNYEPNNCKWSTQTEQQNNRRDTIYLTYNGKTLSLSDWARKLNVHAATLRQRYYRKWPIGEILQER